MEPENELSAEEKIRREGYADPVFFLQFFLSNLFPKPVPWVHRGILAILTRKTDFLLKYGELDKIISNFTWKEDPLDANSPEHAIFTPILDEAGNIISLTMRYTKYSQIMLPRGFSKTTLAGIGVVLYWILYQEKKFPVYISESGTHAEMQLKNVRSILEANELIHAVFGKLQPDRQDSKKWTDDIIQTTTGVTVVARGRGGQVRGLNVEGQRPDCILLDDVEDKESVKTEAQRHKAKDWMYSDIMPALPEMQEEATILALGTLLHSEALLMTLHKDPEWTSIVFGVRDKQGDLLWADNMTEKKIEAKKAAYARAGLLSSYYMEYENTVRSIETQKFKPESFTILPRLRDELVSVAIALDPAISQESQADYRAIGVVGMTDKGIIHGLDFWASKTANEREMVDTFFELAVKHDCTLHGIESIAFQRVMIHLMREEMFRKAKVYGAKAYFEIIPITHSNQRQSKDDRISGILAPRMSAGYITFQRNFPLLFTQLQDFPMGKKDLPDVFAMAVHLLDPLAPMAGVGEDGFDLAADEYEPLEDMLGEEWRKY